VSTRTTAKVKVTTMAIAGTPRTFLHGLCTVAHGKRVDWIVQGFVGGGLHRLSDGKDCSGRESLSSSFGAMSGSRACFLEIFASPSKMHDSAVCKTPTTTHHEVSPLEKR